MSGMINLKRLRTSKSTQRRWLRDERMNTSTEQGIYRKGTGSSKANWRYQDQIDPVSPLALLSVSRHSPAGNRGRGVARDDREREFRQLRKLNT